MEKTFDELMRTSYDTVGIERSPFRLPLWLRRIAARLASYHPALFALIFWGLSQTWGRSGSNHPNRLARDWCEMARQLTLRQAGQLADAIAALDRHPTFALGARAHGARNCLDSMFLRSACLDVFFEPAPLPRTETSDPHQRPYYLVPGIPAHRFYPKEQFDWARPLEESYPVILEELEGLLADRSGFGTYQTEYDTAVAGWNTYPLWLYGQRHEVNAARCPRTLALLEKLPGFETGEWILFSALNPQSVIPPHVGPLNGILRGHLAMVIPDGCGLRVGDQETTWQEGKVLVFDDSFVHEVWNRSDRLRLVLFLNFWHPCLSLAEREALSVLRQAYHDLPTGKRWQERQERPLPTTLALRS